MISEPGTEEVRREALHQASVSDQPTTEDTLGFSPYVEAVARFLLNKGTMPPLSMSVEGDWGSGKSSFMKQLQKELERLSASSSVEDVGLEKGILTVWFNAWRHDKSEALWAAFALEFIDQVSKRLSLWRRAYAAWELARKRYDWAAGWWDALRAITMTLIWIVVAVCALVLWFSGTIPVDDLLKGIGVKGVGETLIKACLGSTGLLGILAAIFHISKQVAGIVGNPLRRELKKHIKSVDYTAKVAFIEKFHQDFSKIVRAYAGPARVFVFVDDLDRCEVVTSAELLQALNLMIGQDNPIVFVLGLDREKVAAGLAARSEKILPYLLAQDFRGRDAKDPMAGVEYGLAFMEKFIQLPFRVPQPGPESLEKFLAGLKGAPIVETRPRTRNIHHQQRRSAPPAPPQAEQEEKMGREIIEEAQSEAPVPESVKRWGGFELRVAESSETIQELVRMVAPALDHNPRRLKQFVNTFRLKAYLCFVTGLFNPPLDDAGGSPLTFEQLAKFVAITLRWPLLLNDLYENPDLLKTISKESVPDAKDPAQGYWCKLPRLVELIEYEPSKASASTTTPGKHGGKERFDLKKLNVGALLRTSPRVRIQSLATDEGVPNAPETGISPQSTSAITQRSFRIISGTESPNGRYAIGWGFARTDVDWERYRQEDGTYMADQSDHEEIRNYIVEVVNLRIVAQTQGKHFGDNRKYNHRTVDANWDAKSRILVEVNSVKWATDNASVYRIDDVGNVDGSDNLLQLATERAKAEVARINHPTISYFDRMTIKLYDVEIEQDGQIIFHLSGEVPKSSDPALDAEMVVRVEVDSSRDLSMIVEKCEITDEGAADSDEDSVASSNFASEPDSITNDPSTIAGKELLGLIKSEDDPNLRGIVEIRKEVRPGLTHFFPKLQYSGAPRGMKSRSFHEGVAELVEGGWLLPPEENDSTNTRTYEWAVREDTASTRSTSAATQPLRPVQIRKRLEEIRLSGETILSKWSTGDLSQEQQYRRWEDTLERFAEDNLSTIQYDKLHELHAIDANTSFELHVSTAEPVRANKEHWHKLQTLAAKLELIDAVRDLIRD